MTTNRWLASATKFLNDNSIATARLDALVLLEDVTGHDRAYLLAFPETILTTAKQAKLKKLLSRRAKHEPLAYVRGHTEFYGREFVITPAVLEPRPESETMIELLKEVARNLNEEPKLGVHDKQSRKTGLKRPHAWRIADVGAGSGALGITAKVELPEAEIDLLELDPGALKVAQTNVDKFTLSISVLKTDLLRGSALNYDILLCNLPYVPDDYQINRAAGQEPKIAIFGGPDGLDIYRQLFDQLKIVVNLPLYILTEALPPQHDTLNAIAESHGYHLTKTDDFIQVFALRG